MPFCTPLARGMLQQRELDGFATNKASLFEMADQLPGARMPEGRCGLEQLAIAVPKWRGVAAEFLRHLAESARTEGLLRRAAEHAALRGVGAAT